MNEQQTDVADYLLHAGFKFGSRTKQWRVTVDGRYLTLQECEMPVGWHLLYADGGVDAKAAKSYGLIVEPTGRAHVYFHEGRRMLWAKSDGGILMLNSGLYFIEPSRPASYVTVEPNLVEECGQLLVSKLADVDTKTKGKTWLPVITDVNAPDMTVTASTFVDLARFFPLSADASPSQLVPLSTWLPSSSSSSSSSPSSSAQPPSTGEVKKVEEALSKLRLGPQSGPPATDDVKNVGDALRNLKLEPENKQRDAETYAKAMAKAIYGEQGADHVEAIKEYAEKKIEGKPTPKGALPASYFAGGPEWNDMVKTSLGQKWTGNMVHLVEFIRMYRHNLDVDGNPRDKAWAPKESPDESFKRVSSLLRHFADKHMKETFGIRIAESPVEVQNLISAADAELIRLAAMASDSTLPNALKQATFAAAKVVDTLKAKLNGNYGCFLQLWRCYALLHYYIYRYRPLVLVPAPPPGPQPSLSSSSSSSSSAPPPTVNKMELDSK